MDFYQFFNIRHAALDRILRFVAVVGKPASGDRARRPADAAIRREWSPAKRATVTAREKR